MGIEIQMNIQAIIRSGYYSGCNLDWSIDLTIEGNYGDVTPGIEKTFQTRTENSVSITVGDSRLGWTEAYRQLLELASTLSPEEDVWIVNVDISNIRPKGSLIKGFGGVTNPTGFEPMLKRIIKITNSAVGRQLKPIEVSKLLNEAALCTVAGNVRRSARIDQFSKEDEEGGYAKIGLWVSDKEGNWRIDPERDALRMANFTRVWHQKPTRDEVLKALQVQFQSAEGAIQFAPEAIARANSDILDTPKKKSRFISAYCEDPESAKNFLSDLADDDMDERELEHRLDRYGLNPCGSC